MNFLAHAFLAGPADADRVGGVAGDFVKGVLPAGLPPDLAAGVALHRRIDSFADTHAAFRRSRARVSAGRRRLAGVMVDMFYDHFLALHWARLHAQPLEQFTAETYALMQAHAAALPESLRDILPAMRRDDWLASYRSTDAVGHALDRMSRYRLRRPNLLAGSVCELLADYRGFEIDFEDFIGDAAGFAVAVRAVRVGGGASPAK